MGLLNNDQSITVDGSARTYTKAFAAKYAKELRDGNTTTLKCGITGGESVLRVSHDYSKGQERHLVSLEETYVDANGDEHFRKVHRVFQSENDASQETAAILLDDALDAWIATAGIKQAIVNGEL